MKKSPFVPESAEIKNEYGQCFKGGDIVQFGFDHPEVGVVTEKLDDMGVCFHIIEESGRHRWVFAADMIKIGSLSEIRTLLS
jgi:hypothetical protein